MISDYYIQRTGEKARNINHFFQINTDLGILSSEPISANNGDTYINSTSHEVGVWVEGAWVYSGLVVNSKIYDVKNKRSKIYTGVGPTVDDYYTTDYFYDEGIFIIKTDNLTTLPERKETYKENWKDEQGEDTFLPENTLFQAKEVEVEFFIKNLSKTMLRTKLDSFLKYVGAKGHLNYFDTFKGQGFRGYYVKHEVSEERYKEGLYWQKFKVTFVVDKLCYGYDTTPCGALAIRINEGMEGTYELHLSNGGYGIFNEESYISSSSSRYIIVVPQFLDLINISCEQPSPIGLQSSGDWVIGVQSNGNYIIGV